MILKRLKKLFRLPGKKKGSSHELVPVIIPRSEHIISRTAISEQAVKVLYRLKNNSYAAYLVGGGVRDLLLGHKPKDFDIATNARPEEVQHLFRNCRLIGRRFRLAHIHFGQHIIEVATFRAGTVAGDESHKMITDDNIYGTLEQDAFRRDFTVNALYYNIDDFSIVDYCGGLSDLANKTLRMIGSPEKRYREDPVRMLRAIRFAAKLGFTIEPHTEKPIFALGHLLEQIPPARLYEEVLKLFLTGHALPAYELLTKYQLFPILFPQTAEALLHTAQNHSAALLHKVFANTDIRIEEDKRVTPIFILAALLWHPFLKRVDAAKKDKPEHIAVREASDEVLYEQTRRVSMQKKFSLGIKEIWEFQFRFAKHGRRADWIVEHPRFRAAYDFLLLRVEAGEPVQELADWWTRYKDADAEERLKMVRLAQAGSGNKRRPNHRKRRRKPAAATTPPAASDDPCT